MALIGAILAPMQKVMEWRIFRCRSLDGMLKAPQGRMQGLHYRQDLSRRKQVDGR
jgi:hypothetical protein